MSVKSKKIVRHPIIRFWYWLRRYIKNQFLLGFRSIFPPRPVPPSKPSPPPKPAMTFYIDVSSVCNLSCPSCPVGQDDEPMAKGLMTEDRLRKILEKATRECSVSAVALYNWTEPFLHPKLPELIALVRSFGLQCGISTNLNLLRDADSFVAADPTYVRISLSGFTQEIYSRGHRKGQIDRVKENMRLLAKARDRAVASGKEARHYEVYYHKYIDNAPDEPLMREYALSLGYKFDTVWAFLMPIEKMLAVAGRSLEPTPLSEDDHKLLDRLALPFEKILKSPTRKRVTSCSVRDDFVVLDVQGDAWLCCGCSGKRTNMVGNYLQFSLDELQKKRRRHSLCGPCMALGLPIIAQEAHDPDFAWYEKEATLRRETYREDSSKIDKAHLIGADISYF